MRAGRGSTGAAGIGRVAARAAGIPVPQHAEARMRPAIVLWLVHHGLPGWLAPDYAILVGLAGIVGAHLFLRLARRDRADVAIEARALALGYVAALLGGYVFEA